MKETTSLILVESKFFLLNIELCPSQNHQFVATFVNNLTDTQINCKSNEKCAKYGEEHIGVCKS